MARQDLAAVEPAPLKPPRSPHTVRAGVAFLAKAATEKDATKTASGLVFKNVKVGTGPAPTPSDVVKVHYYSDHGTGLATNGGVIVALYEHDPIKSKTKTFVWSLPRSGAQGQSCCNQSPGSTGPDWWLSIPAIDVVGDNIP